LIELIGELRARGLPLALATSAPAQSVDWILRGLGLTDVFSVVLSERDVTIGKPNPQIYCKAFERLGCPADRCIVFEDATVGIIAARAAGARCIALSTSFEPAALLNAGAERVIRDFREVTAASL
jgi:HAD superfamily hydrolase (TIGR01509 family)